MEGRGVTSSIPITTTITGPSLKTCPEWWMIKTRVKSPALRHRLMIIPPAIAHGRSDGFIAAEAAESRREENISGGFKILHGHEKKEERNEMSGHVLPAFVSPFHCLSTGDFAHLSHHHAAMACCCQQKGWRLIRACDLPTSSSSLASMDLSGHRLTLHQLGGVSCLLWRAKGTNCFFSKLRTASAFINGSHVNL